MPGAFKKAVQGTRALAHAYRDGLQAIRSADHQRMICQEPRRLTGSVDMDEALRSSHPNDARWDYGIGVNRIGERVLWVEVHPASSDHVKEIVAKVTWLRNWLKSEAHLLAKLPCRFVWVASGTVGLTRTGRQLREVAKAGIHFAGRRLVLDH
jgi:hypothetical protein